MSKKRERIILPYQVDNLTNSQLLQCISHRVGYILSSWLVNQLINRGINHTVFKQFVFIDKNNPEYDKLILKRRFKELTPVILLELKDKELVKDKPLTRQPSKVYGNIVVKVVG